MSTPAREESRAVPSGVPGGLERAVFHVLHLGYEQTPVGLARQLATWRGISRVIVDPSAALVTLEYDSARWSAEGLRRAIATCGYRCRETCDGSCHVQTRLRCGCAEAVTEAVTDTAPDVADV